MYFIHHIASKMIRNVMLLILLPDLYLHCTRGYMFTNADGNVGEKLGHPCTKDDDCTFRNAVCDKTKNKCQCHPNFPVTNHIDKCGNSVAINESCTFSEECEAFMDETECKNDVCTCRFEKLAVSHGDGWWECTAVPNIDEGVPKYRDPAMIGILVAMILMFITICVVLRLFSKARWRENRTIFNTPNPRLMNASLLREHKDRRGSKTSVKGPSRQSSLLSLSKSPDSAAKKGSHADIYGSKTSLHSIPDQSRSKLMCNDEKVAIDI